ncbi:hypothetical protein [Coxiella burnetii]|uniref:hypothetical protein n=1 Tax=Coxiella burnetii TaxID=777 RepID=UPI0021AECB37|nr:hypothetical protein [Coxiella burnetii]
MKKSRTSTAEISFILRRSIVLIRTRIITARSAIASLHIFFLLIIGVGRCNSAILSILMGAILLLASGQAAYEEQHRYDCK